MKNLYKISAFVLLVTMSTFLLSACSEKEEVTETPKAKNEAEINSKYDDIINAESKEELLPEDYNPILNNFTTVDFQFTMTDDTLAFNLAENSFTKITGAGASFGFLDNNLPSDYFEGSFKNAKGINIASTVGELVNSYKLGAENYSTDEAGITTFAFATDGSYEFATLSANDALRASAAYNNGGTEAVMEAFDKYTTLALVTITQSEDGSVSEFAMYRFDKAVQE